MAVPPLIPLMPPAPARSQGQATFNVVAEPFIAAMPPMVVNINAALTWMGQTMTTVDGYRQAAATSAGNAATSAGAAADQVQLAKDQVNLAKDQVQQAQTARSGAEAARDSAQNYATAAGAATGFPTLTNPFDVLMVNADKTGVVWGIVGQQVGDVLATARNPGSTYLPANGGVYLKTAYPLLAALLSSISDLPNTAPVSKLLPSSAAWADVLYVTGAGATPKFFAIAKGPSTVSAYSPNAITWTALTLPSSQSWVGLSFNISFTIAVAPGTNIFAYLQQSQASPSWTQVGLLSTTANWVDSASDGSNFLVLSSDGVTTTSSSSINTWSTASSAPAGVYAAVIYGGGRYVATGTVTARRVSATWVASARQPAAAMGCLAYGNGLYVALGSGNSNVAAVSVDADNWDSVTLPAYGNWVSVSYGNGYFVAVSSGTSPTLIYSTDGYNWSLKKAALTMGRSSIAFGANAFAILPVSGNTGESWVSFSYDTSTQFVTPNQPASSGANTYIKAKVS